MAFIIVVLLVHLIVNLINIKKKIKKINLQGKKEQWI